MIHVHIKDFASNRFMEIVLDDEEKLQQFKQKLVENNAWFVISCTNSKDKENYPLIGTGNTTAGSN